MKQKELNTPHLTHKYTTMAFLRIFFGLNLHEQRANKEKTRTTTMAALEIGYFISVLSFVIFSSIAALMYAVTERP